MARHARPLPDWLPHWEDALWWQRYWQDVRPRLVLVRLKVDRFHLRWGMPLWALEESLRFGLLTLPWIAYGWQRLPRRWRRELGRPVRGRPERPPVIDPPARPPWPALVALLEGHGEGMLRLESGEPFVLIDAGDRGQRVLIEITQF